MNRRIRNITAALVAAAVMAGVGAGVAAAATTPPRVAIGHDDRAPSAQLQLTGSGKIVLSGRFTISGNLRTRATLSVVDRAGDATLHVAGNPAVFKRGRTTVRRALGIIYASGSDMTLQLNGNAVEVSAAGVGKARLTGSGRYQLNTARERSWPRSWIRVVPSDVSLALLRSRR